jgi:transposase
MAKELVNDELWELIQPLLPPPKPRRFRFPGRKPISDRQALTGILFVLKSGIPWEMLPKEMGCGPGMTCWHRLLDWRQAGVWQKLHELLLAQLREADQIDWSRAVVDSASVRAVGGGEKNRPQSHRPAQAG